MTAGLYPRGLVAAWSQVKTSGSSTWSCRHGPGPRAVLYEPAFAVVVRWFHDRRRALLAVTLVAGFASTVALPTANALTESLGWRDSPAP